MGSNDLLWPDSVCPMLDAGTNGKTAVEHYHLSERQVKAWCYEGCSVECGRLLQETMEKQRKGVRCHNRSGAQLERMLVE